MTNKSSSPIIGVLPDFNRGGENKYSKMDFYAIRKNYLDSINKYGGAPILLTYNYQAIDDYINLLDGLMIVGGDMDISPSRYGENTIHPTVKLNLERENFECEIVKKVLATKLPILAICNGMQLVSILHGGNIIQHIPDNPQFINHEQSHHPDFKLYSKPYHEVTIDKKSKFYSITKLEKISVNSSHHQAVKDVGKGIVAVGKAADGIVEAIEKVDHPFCIGVQWHPEHKSSASDELLFEEFVKQSIIFKANKKNI